ncbi:phosphotransferase family protein [Nocardioides sp. NPDC047086]|uniref:phosphotransferase family protein n=1 Tax=Nocardioides sp. NPDC047086 TaxID=3154810 RepID=UPI0034031F8E
MTGVLAEIELAVVRRRMLAAGAEVGPELDGSLISGGRSNLTVLLDDGVCRWVLRTPPRHGRTPSAHDVGREFRVTSGLATTDVPVAAPVVFCEDEALLGGPFSVWEFVDGVTVQSRDQLDALGSEVVDGITGALVETLAALHRVDHVVVGLERFGRPDAYVRRQITRWSGQWELVAPGDATVQDHAIAVRRLLEEQIPEQVHTSIVHGDYRIDNALLDLTGTTPRVAAVVDWELSTIGDPVADVATMCAYRHPAFDQVLGFPTAWTSPSLDDADALAQRYERAGGVELAHWPVHLGLAYYKIAVIAAGIDYRWRAEGAPEGGNDTAGSAVAPFLEAALTTLTAEGLSRPPTQGARCRSTTC